LHKNGLSWDIPQRHSKLPILWIPNLFVYITSVVYFFLNSKSALSLRMLCPSSPFLASYKYTSSYHVMSFLVQQCCWVHLCNRHWHSEVCIVPFNDSFYFTVYDAWLHCCFVTYRKKITYLAPSSGELPSKYLIMGSLTWLETWTNEQCCTGKSLATYIFMVRQFCVVIKM